MYTFRWWLLFLALPLSGQVRGWVKDPAGAPVRGARFEVVQPATGAAWAAISGEGGEYRFLALPPGEHRLSVGQDGFGEVRRNFTLRVGEQLTLDIELPLREASAALEVSAAAPLLQTNRGSVGMVVDQQRVINLPLDGRNFVPLLALSPGVSLPPGGVLPRINGSRPRVSEYIYDGISVLQPEPGQVAFYPVIDAIEEFRVETSSYAAEYGRSNGGVILVNQKAGTNQWRGTLFEFFRNEKLNARNLFASGGGKPQFRRNQYGFVAGGPIQRNRTFVFGDWQGTQLTTGAVQTSTVPTLAQRRGVFSNSIFDPAAERVAFPGNAIPASRFDRAALALLERYPLPTSGAAANNYRRLGTESTVANQFDGRLDRYFGTRHRVFGRYSYLRDDSRPATPLPDGSGNLTSGVIGNTLTRADGLAMEHTWSISAAAVNQVRLGVTGRRFARSALRGQELGTLIPNLSQSSFGDVLPTFDVVGWQQLGPPASGNGQFQTSVTQFLEHYSHAAGRHIWKAGGDVRREALDVLQPPSPTGNFQFTDILTAGLNSNGQVVASTGSSFASFLLGQVGRFSMDSQPETIRPRATIAEFFLQDDWRMTSRLSVNLGARYTLNFPSTVIGDRGAVFNLVTQQLDFLGANRSSRSARRLEKANLAPRAGVAWRVTPSWVMRAGYGMTWIEQAGITTPFTTPLFPFIETLGQQQLDNRTPAFVLSEGPTVTRREPGAESGLGQGVFGVQSDNGSGYAQQWNFTLQKTSGEHWSWEMGYLGSKLTRLGVPDVNLNQLTVEQLARGNELTTSVANPYFGRIPANTSLGTPTIPRGQLLRPYPRFTTVALYRNNIGHSTYHSWQSRLEKRLARGLTLSAAYTFSKLIDDAGAVFDAAILTGPVATFQVADSFNRRLEKDVSTGNLAHNFSGSLVYVMPHGWLVAGIARAQSGSPIAVTQATNLNAFAGFGIQRPNRLRDPSLPAAERSTGAWFDKSAFAPAAQFTIGNSSRNPVVGPGYRTLDVMVGKTLTIRDRFRVEIRAEAFNLTNTPPLGNPNGSFGTAAFGTITTALDPRVFELVMKVHF